MKKVLFGIIALSMATFAVTNPGEIDDTTKKGTASVPVKVLAEVIEVTDAIVITDEAGNTIGANGIILDHETRTQADGLHTTAPFRFKVKRVATGGSQPIDGELTVAINAPGTGAATGHPVTLGKVGGGATDTLTSTLKLENGKAITAVSGVHGEHGYTANMGDTLTEHTGEITSTVDFSSAAAGKYESGLNETRPELVVTIAAN